jgi:hypothetical protein
VRAFQVLEATIVEKLTVDVTVTWHVFHNVCPWPTVAAGSAIVFWAREVDEVVLCREGMRLDFVKPAGWMEQPRSCKIMKIVKKSR